MVKRKAKRKPSAFNKAVGAARRQGKTFKQAVRIAKKKTSSRARTATRSTRRVFKKKRTRIVTMVRRRAKIKTRRRSSGGFGIKGLGGLPTMLKNAGFAFAIGAGASAVIANVGRQFNQPLLVNNANLVGAFTAFNAASGIPAIAAAFPFIQSLGVLSGGGTAQQSSDF